MGPLGHGQAEVLPGMHMMCKAGPLAQAGFICMAQKGIAEERRESRERCVCAAPETVTTLGGPDQEPGKVTSQRRTWCVRPDESREMSQ